MKSIYKLSGINRNPAVTVALRSSSASTFTCSIHRRAFTSSAAALSAVKIQSPSRGFKTDSTTNQALSGSTTSFASSLHSDPLFSTSFDRSKQSSSSPSSTSPPSSTTSYMPGLNTTSWSSPHDSINRHQFLKDYSHLWTLLEACLESGNFERAEHVLISFSEHSDSKDLTMAVNNYLLRLSELNSKDSNVSQTWLRNISRKIPKFSPDTITRAIILKNKCLHYDYEESKIASYIRQYSTDILKHVDVLGIDMIAKIVKVSFFCFHNMRL